MIERLWRSVQYEEIYLKDYASVRELKQSLKKYFEFINMNAHIRALTAAHPAEVYYGRQKLQVAA